MPTGPAFVIEAVVFDFDGTLADTSGAVVATVAQTLAQLGAAPLAALAAEEVMGLPLAEGFRTAGIADSEIAEAVVRYRQLFPGNAVNVALFPALSVTVTC